MPKYAVTRGPLTTELLERAISAIGKSGTLANKIFKSGVMLPADDPYLSQFLRPEKDIVPRTNLRPASLSFDDSNREDWRQSAYAKPQVAYTTGSFLEELLSGRSKILEYPFADDDGLGNYLRTMSLSPEGNLYGSIYDKWDFGKSPNIHPVVGKVLDMIGKPFHVYQRYDVKVSPDPDAHGYRLYSTPKK